MQRVRIGVTGLAVVFLLVLLTAALIGNIRRGPVAHAASGAAQTGAADAPKEPLAELGVAPGSTPADGNATSTAIAPVAGPHVAAPAPITRGH